MSGALQGISRASSLADFEIVDTLTEPGTALSRESSLADFQIIDAEPAAESAAKVEESGTTSDTEDHNSESEAESDFEEVVANASPSSEADHQHELLAAQGEDEVESLHSDDTESASDEDESLHSDEDIESVHSDASAEIPEAISTAEVEATDKVGDADVHESSDAATRDSAAKPTSDVDSLFEELAGIQKMLDGIPEANPASDSAAKPTSDVDSLFEELASIQKMLDEIPEANPASEAELQVEELEASPAVAAGAESSAKARRRQGMTPAEVQCIADTVAQTASEAVLLIRNLDDRLDSALPHIVDGLTYFKQQAQDDFEGAGKEMRDAFGEAQESERTVAATFSHFQDQCRSDFKHIRKDLDSAFGCFLGSTNEHDGAAVLNSQQLPAAVCSIVSVACAAWLVPVRLARFSVANIAM